MTSNFKCEHFHGHNNKMLDKNFRIFVYAILIGIVQNARMEAVVRVHQYYF